MNLALATSGKAAPAPIAPGTPSWGFDAAATKTVATNGTGAAPADGGLVGRVAGYSGAWISTADAYRPFWRAAAFGGLGGIECGDIAGAIRDLRWSGTANFGTAWTVYMVLDITNGSANSGRILSITDDSAVQEYNRDNGFNLKLTPALFSEYRNVLFSGIGIEPNPLPFGRVAVAIRYGTQGVISVVGSSVKIGSWANPGSACQPTRAMLGSWIDSNHAEPTTAIVGRIDLYNAAHDLETIRGRLRWYQEVYDCYGAATAALNRGGGGTVIDQGGVTEL